MRITLRCVVDEITIKNENTACWIAQEAEDEDARRKPGPWRLLSRAQLQRAGGVLCGFPGADAGKELSSQSRSAL
jgi:hypothetical protein